jgi:hypothetical protein
MCLTSSFRILVGASYLLHMARRAAANSQMLGRSNATSRPISQGSRHYRSSSNCDYFALIDSSVIYKIIGNIGIGDHLGR